MLRRIPSLLRLQLVAALCFAPTGAACSPADPFADASIDPRAQAAVDRSRSTTATYALYGWNWVLGADGEPGPGWSAEFHRGSLHRVETLIARIVADCAARTGTMLIVATGERQTGESVANAACGVNANPRVLTLEWLGRRQHRFGPVELMRLVDPAEIRTYAIDDTGVLVAAEIIPRDSEALYCVQNEAIAVERTLPDGDIFSEASLDRIVTPERYRVAPRRPVADLWTREPFCF